MNGRLASLTEGSTAAPIAGPVHQIAADERETAIVAALSQMALPHGAQAMG
jgi:hypothetical protein